MRREALLAICAVGLWAAGAVVTSGLSAPVSATAITSDLRLSVREARWVHHEGHDPRVPMPAAMMNGAPADGQHRLSLELAVANPGSRAASFSTRELGVVSASGRISGVSTDGERFELPPRTNLHVKVSFDVAEQDEAVTVEWQRARERRGLLVTRVPKLERTAPSDWPEDVKELPPGDPERGRELFVRRGCSACHGTLEGPGNATLGPELAPLPSEAATRRPRIGAAQYVYESLLKPNAFLAPHCAGGRPCASPSTMPAFDRTLVPSEAADLIALLLAREKGGS